MKKQIAAFAILHCTLYIVRCTSLFAQTTGTDTNIQVLNLAPQINTIQDTTVTVVLPDTSYKYETIRMHYLLNKPTAGWDPWDRIAYIRVFTPTDTFEIARIMTPYSKECGWTIDVTDYRSILAGTVKLNSFILFWASGNKGYLVSIHFEFIGGTPKKEAYKIQNLWGNDALIRWEYGNYLNPINNYILLKSVTIDPAADSVKVKITTTGHGQGNTGNAAEFSNKIHTLRIDSTTTVSHNLWRSNCASNPCSPQSGTWTYNRAGWCPGADVLPWDVDITPSVIPGNPATIEYWPQVYQNYCSPADSNCVTGVTCTDCNYNSNGHTMPWYLMQSQIVYYKNIYPVGIDNKSSSFGSQSAILIFPNPSSGNFMIDILIPTREKTIITIMNAQGSTVFEKISNEKTIQVNLSDYARGIYLVKVQTENTVTVKKITYK